MEASPSEDPVTLNKVLAAIPMGGADLSAIARASGLDHYTAMRALGLMCKDEVIFRYGTLRYPFYQKRI